MAAPRPLPPGSRLRPGIGGLLIGLALATGAAAADGVAMPDEVRTLLNDQCLGCHNAEKQKGELDLAKLLAGDLTPAALRAWRTARQRVAANEMPPEEAKRQPTAAERGRLVAWLAGLRYQGPPDPGRVTVRRLNRVAYDNTIRDLLGLDLKAAAEFPSDDVGEGFDDLGDVLSLPPILFEKYLAAADRILDRALVREQVQVKLDAGRLATVVDGKPVDPVDGPRTLEAFGEISADFPCPADGRYTIKVQAGGEQAGDEPVRLALKVDNEVVKEFRLVKAGLSPQTASVALERGPRKLSLVFLNPFQESAAPAEDAGKDAAAKPKPGAARPKPAAKPAAPVAKPAAGPPRTRAVHVAAIELTGPPAPAATESHRRIMFAKPGKDLAPRDAARQIVARFADRAFRRPAAPAEVDDFLGLYDLADQQGRGFTASVRLALSGVLVSPQFLFRIEKDHPADTDGVYRVDDYELASRLSYFLWSSMPDDELFAAAKDGSLHRPEVLAQQATRLLKDPRSRALVDNFFGQWLLFRNLSAVDPDAKAFPEFDKGLRAAMLAEIGLFCEMLLREDGSVLDLIDCDHTWLNDRLAKHYGIADVFGSQMRKVTLTNHDRGGVLTMAATLTVTSNPNRTSPVKRGKFILDQILGDPPPPPPAAVNLADAGAETRNLTLRARLERHRADPVCASCHQRMDPIGFAFEGFDGIGRVRERDNGQPIDATGEMPDGKKFAGPAQLKALFLKQKEAFARCLTEKLMIYALGRAPIAADDAAVSAIADAAAKDGYKFSAFVQGLVASYPFQHRRLARPEASP